jgi:hypothetical protein
MPRQAARADQGCRGWRNSDHLLAGCACRRHRPDKAPNGKKRKLGALKGKIQILDIDWWKPMSEDEADAFVEGRD